jgi:hypothetical protein
VNGHARGHVHVHVYVHHVDVPHLVLSSLILVLLLLLLLLSAPGSVCWQLTADEFWCEGGATIITRMLRCKLV